MDELIKKYVCALDDEEEAFNLYKHIAHLDAAHKAELINIMADEMRHYEMIHKFLFSFVQNNSAIEKAFKHSSEKTLEEMKLCLAEIKK